MKQSISSEVTKFFRESWIELSRVEWPTKSEFIGATIITLVFVFFFSIFLSVADKGIKWLIYDTLFNMVKK